MFLRFEDKVINIQNIAYIKQAKDGYGNYIDKYLVYFNNAGVFSGKNNDPERYENCVFLSKEEYEKLIAKIDALHMLTN